MTWLQEKILKFISKHKDWIVCLVWPTASWKTGLSLDLIQSWLDAEIISADSRQIYRYMNIWTDKVSKEIQYKIPHHLIDICDPDESFTAWSWHKLAKEKIFDIQKKGKIPLITWWTWLYVDTLYKNYTLPEAPPDREFRKNLYEKESENPWVLHDNLKLIDPISAKKIHPNSLRYIIRALEIFHQTWRVKSDICKQQPVEFPILILIKRADKSTANPKIDHRIEEMVENWLIQEIEWLLNMWFTFQSQAMQSIWYKEFSEFFAWKSDLDTSLDSLRQNTYRYAKRQRTFFRRYINDKKNPKENVYFEIL